MKKTILFFATLCFAALSARSQTTYLPIGSDDYLYLDRVETRSGRLCDSIELSDRGESRKSIMQYLRTVIPAQGRDTSNTYKHLSPQDRYNLRQIMSENGEWADDENGAINSKHSLWHTFYKKQYDFLHINKEGFFLVVNPVLNYTVLQQHNSATYASFKGLPSQVGLNKHDAEARGWIGKKIGFYTAVTDNQEMFPSYVENSIKKTYMAIPGEGYFIGATKPTDNYNYLSASGYIDFAAIKNHLQVTFGSGKHFFGDGTTSLFLSDYSANTPFLQLKARIWKLNYDILYLELTQQYNKNLGDALYNHKYASMHYVTMNVTRWLNLGFFESVVFDRPNSYEISYLNPAVIYLSVNNFNGNGDKALIGFSAKAIAGKHFQFYEQVILNEFKASEFFGNKGWYGNKWGLQLGGKYFDALGINNLDLQGEIDMVRPYTYMAKDTLANYTNYNQPLADPLGAGFIKMVGIARYQAGRNLSFTLKLMSYAQGVDTGNVNYGNNIFNPYSTAPKGPNTYGVSLINGPRSQCTVLDFNISYQLRRNIFIDAGAVSRSYSNASHIYPDYTTTGAASGPLNTTYTYFGLRINAARRDYSYF